jgi:hypothetical protein
MPGIRGSVMAVTVFRGIRLSLNDGGPGQKAV